MAEVREIKLIDVVINNLKTYESSAKFFKVIATTTDFYAEKIVAAKKHDTMPICVQSEPILFSVPYGVELSYTVSIIGKNADYSLNSLTTTKTVSENIIAPDAIAIGAYSSRFDIMPTYEEEVTDISKHEYYIMINSGSYSESSSMPTIDTMPTHISPGVDYLVLSAKPDDHIRVWCRRIDTSNNISEWFPDNINGITAIAPEVHIEINNPVVIDIFNQMVYNETPSGDKNGLNKNFTLANEVHSESDKYFLSVMINGMKMMPGDGNDYTFAPASKLITFTEAPISTDNILADYIKVVD